MSEQWALAGAPEPAVAPRGHAISASAAGAAASAQPPGKRPTRGAAERAALLSQAAAAEEVRLRVTRLGRDMSNTFCAPGFFTVRRSDRVRQQRRRCITRRNATVTLCRLSHHNLAQASQEAAPASSADTPPSMFGKVRSRVI